MKRFKNPCVYILLCNDNSFYIGVTNNIERRFDEHCQALNPNCYTFTRLPVKLVYKEIYPDFESAFKREKQLKRWSREKKEALISGNYEKLVHLAKNCGSAGSP